MVDQDFEVVEVPFAVVAPWPRKDLFEVGMTALLLRHVERSNIRRYKEKTRQNRNCNQSQVDLESGVGC